MKCYCLKSYIELIVATAEDSPLAMKLKKTWLRTPVGEEQAAQAVLDPSIGTKFSIVSKYPISVFLL